MKRKVWNITVKDNPNRVVMGENDEFYTTDTEAYLVFNLDDKNFNPATAVLTLENRNDGSLKNETVDVVDGLIEWEMPQRYIEHFGNWQGQLVYYDPKEDVPEDTPEEDKFETYTSAPFTFVVNAHIGDKKKPSLVEIENWEKFIRDGTELIETWEDMEDLRQANEQQRQDNYQELLDTGVLQTNINTKLEQLEEEYAPKLTEVTAQLAQTDMQLEQKVGDGVKAEPEDLSATLLGMITGTGGPINLLSIPQDKSVTPEKTTFARHSKNLYNQNTSIDNTTLVSGGEVIAHTGATEEDLRTTSDFIPILGNTTYVSNVPISLQVYGEDKNAIGTRRDVRPDRPLTTVGLARYARFMFKISDADKETVQLEQGSVPTEYEPYGLIIEDLVVDGLSNFMTEENKEWMI